MNGFTEFFFSEENRNPSPQKRKHVSSSLAVKPPAPVRDGGVEPPQNVTWKPKKAPTDGGLGIIPNLIPRPQTVFGNKRPLDNK